MGVDKGRLYNYNTNPMEYFGFKHLPHEKAGEFEDALRYYGVELEVVVKAAGHLKDALVHVHDDMGTEFAMFKTDSSIQGEGFEIVTAPATLAYHKQEWQQFFKNSSKELKSYSTGCCGMHVHVGRDSLTPLVIGKLIAFINNPANRAFVSQVAGRTSEYATFSDSHNALAARILGKKVATQPGVSKTGDILNYAISSSVETARRSAINTRKKDTIEFRIFKGNVSKVGFFKNLEFVDSAIEYAKLIRYTNKSAEELAMEARRAKHVRKGEESHSYSLLYTDYLQWLARDKSGKYTYLKLWLTKNNVFDYGGKKVTDKTPKEHIITDSEILDVA